MNISSKNLFILEAKMRLHKTQVIFRILTVPTATQCNSTQLDSWTVDQELSSRKTLHYETDHNPVHNKINKDHQLNILEFDLSKRISLFNTK